LILSLSFFHFPAGRDQYKRPFASLFSSVPSFAPLTPFLRMSLALVDLYKVLLFFFLWQTSRWASRTGWDPPLTLPPSPFHNRAHLPLIHSRLFTPHRIFLSFFPPPPQIVEVKDAGNFSIPPFFVLLVFFLRQARGELPVSLIGLALFSNQGIFPPPTTFFHNFACFMRRNPSPPFKCCA